MDSSYTPDDMDYEKWKVRDAVFSELKFLEPTTSEQQRFVLGLRPFSPDKRQAANAGYGGSGLPTIGGRSNDKRKKKLNLKEQVVELELHEEMLMKELQGVNDRACMAEKQFQDSTDRETALSSDLEMYEVEIEDLRRERDELKESKKQMGLEFERLQEKFQAYMAKEMSKFPTREPSNLVFGKPSKAKRAPTREIHEAHQEMVWFEQRHGKKPKKKKSGRRMTNNQRQQSKLAASRSLPALS